MKKDKNVYDKPEFISRNFSRALWFRQKLMKTSNFERKSVQTWRKRPKMNLHDSNWVKTRQSKSARTKQRVSKLMHSLKIDHVPASFSRMQLFGIYLQGIFHLAGQHTKQNVHFLFHYGQKFIFAKKFFPKS